MKNEKRITYQGMIHSIIREFNHNGVDKVELKNLKNNNQFVITKESLKPNE